MSRRTPRDDAGMDLFPFMAVLICTVGALIMLLVVMVQQARVKAGGPAEPAIAQQASQAQRALDVAAQQSQQQLAAEQQAKFDEYQWRADLLRSSYEQTVGAVAEQRLALSHLESNTRELSERASAMQAEADLIAKTARRNQREVDSKRLGDVHAEIAAAKTELAAKQEELKNADPKYVLLPYAGPNGTDRRPVYIECLPDRVVLRPENVVLTGDDFVAPLTTDNPLARALRAKREFLQDNQLIGNDSEPYPLLVVRPGAAATYAAARSAMKAWESEFGYELVEQDVQLEYEAADSRLVQLLQDVVADTRERRKMMRVARSRMQPKRRERLRPSASGGFESVGGGGMPGRGGTKPFETGGYAAGDGSSSFGSEPGGSAGFGQQGEFGADGSMGSSRANGFRTSGGNQGQFAGGSDGGSPGQPVQPGQLASRGDGNRYAASGRGGFGGLDGSEHSGGDGGGSSSGSGSDRSGARSGAEAFAGSARNAGERSGVGQGTTGDRNAGMRDNSGGRDAGSSGGVANAGAPGKGGSSANASGGGGRGATGSGGNGSSNPQSAGQPGSAFSAQASSSLADSRGSGWATPSMQQDAVAIQRPIYVLCDGDSISLLPERGTAQQIEIFRHRGSVPGVVDPFVESVQARLKGWGIAGQGIYWNPVLQVKVQQNADAVYRQLQQLLNNSGIEVTREP